MAEIETDNYINRMKCTCCQDITVGTSSEMTSTDYGVFYSQTNKQKTENLNLLGGERGKKKQI